MSDLLIKCVMGLVAIILFMTSIARHTDLINGGPQGPLIGNGNVANNPAAIAAAQTLTSLLDEFGEETI